VSGTMIIGECRDLPIGIPICENENDLQYCMNKFFFVWLLSKALHALTI
jgi:hypothetical protein